jgi:hypothetical protein
MSGLKRSLVGQRARELGSTADIAGLLGAADV